MHCASPTQNSGRSVDSRTGGRGEIESRLTEHRKGLILDGTAVGNDRWVERNLAGFQPLRDFRNPGHVRKRNRPCPTRDIVPGYPLYCGERLL